MSATGLPVPPAPAAPARTATKVPGWAARRTLALVERNLMIYRRSITPLLAMLVEPIMYLLSVGIGVGVLVGAVPGVHVRYASYVAPAILATTAMNTAFNQTSFGVFIRIRLEQTYEAIVPTPLSVTDIALGEVISAVLNAVLTSIGFLVVLAVLGLIVSPGILVALPAAVLIGYAFAAGGLAVTTYLRDFSDFQLIQLVMLPMYLFATTFYPLSVYPGWLRPLIEILPLYQSIQLVREPALGTFTWSALVPVAYLVAFGTIALAIAARRMTRMLLH
jgi:lipooligosaccharide transport system permease protein